MNGIRRLPGLLPLLLLLLGGHLLPVVAGAQEAAEAQEEESRQEEEESPRRPRIASVRFSGNQAFRDSQLRRVMISRPWRIWDPNRYFPDVLAQDLDTLRRFYEQNGYLQARILDHRVRENPERNTVAIEIDIFEGPLTTVSGVTVTGQQAIPEAELLETIDIATGGPFRSPQVRENTLDLMRLYADRGYLEADIRPSLRSGPRENEVAVEFRIEERSLFYVDRILLRGYEKTRAWVIEREISIQPGEIVRYSRLLETQRRLFRTGLFENVFVTPVSPSSGAADRKDILIEVTESNSIELNASVGFSTVGKLGGSLELRNSNIAGTALKTALVASIDFVSRGVEVSFTEPRLFGSLIQADLGAQLEYLIEPAYDLSRIGAEVELSHRLGDRSRVSVGYRYENAQIEEVRLTEDPADLDSNLHSLILSYIVDTRDDLISPTRGFYLQWENEIGRNLTVFPDPFYRLGGTVRGFLPASPTTVTATGLTFGWLTQFGGREDFPLNQRFYVGGSNSLRGFGYQLVGPLDPTGNPLGGTLMAVWNVLEIRQELIGPVGGVLFLDAGGLWSSAEDVSFEDIRYGLGAGLRLSTPIGVARLDGAINMRPRPGEGKGAVYLGFGQAF